VRETEARKIVIGPVITEKGTRVQDKHNQFLFRVAADANKIQIRRAVELLFKVGVVDVRTITVHGKLRRIGRVEGRKPSWKKAIVSLKEGDTISFV